MSTPQSTPATALRDLERALHTTRIAATDDYIARGDVAYTVRTQLRAELCRLIAMANDARTTTPMSLAELRSLTAAGCLTDDHRLTQFGAEQAAAAYLLDDDPSDPLDI